MTKGRQQSSVPTLKLTPLPSPFSCKVALAAPWGWRNLARKGGGEGGGATSPQDLAFNKFRPKKLDFEKLHRIPPCVKGCKGCLFGPEFLAIFTGFSYFNGFARGPRTVSDTHFGVNVWTNCFQPRLGVHAAIAKTQCVRCQGFKCMLWWDERCTWIM